MRCLRLATSRYLLPLIRCLTIFFNRALFSCSGVLTSYLMAVQGAYNDMPYHNATHAADVTQTMNYFLSRGGLAAAAQLTKEMLLGSILAAIVHDVGHIGVNNPFLIATGHALAIRYNDRSPMESMHCATAFELMRADGCDVLQSLKPSQRRETRRCILDMVLATDNAMHTEYLAKFKSKVEQDEMDFDTTADQLLTLQIALHAADVSNPAKPQPVYYKWKDRIVEEFYSQGDRELEAGLPVTPFLDRHKPIPEEKFQSGFIHGIVRPLYAAFAKLEGLELSLVTNTLEENLKVFTDIIASQQPPPPPVPVAAKSADGEESGPRGASEGKEKDPGALNDEELDARIGELPRTNSFDKTQTKKAARIGSLRSFSTFIGMKKPADDPSPARSKFLSKRTCSGGADASSPRGRFGSSDRGGGDTC